MIYSVGVVSYSDPSALRSRLDTYVQRAWHLNQQLESALPYRTSRYGDIPHRQRVGPAPPWHSQAAYLMMELHTQARKLEGKLHSHVVDVERPRGGSDTNTRMALEALVNLSEAVPDYVVVHTLTYLDDWTTRAEVVLGLLEPLRHLPTPPGESEPRCPWCTYMTLRIRMNTVTIHCVNPGCFVDTEHYRRVRGHLEINFFTGDAVIRWEDDLPAKKEDNDES